MQYCSIVWWNVIQRINYSSFEVAGLATVRMSSVPPHCLVRRIHIKRVLSSSILPGSNRLAGWMATINDRQWQKEGLEEDESCYGGLSIVVSCPAGHLNIEDVSTGDSHNNQSCAWKLDRQGWIVQIVTGQWRRGKQLLSLSLEK